MCKFKVKVIAENMGPGLTFVDSKLAAQDRRIYIKRCSNSLIHTTIRFFFVVVFHYWVPKIRINVTINLLMSQLSLNTVIER